MIAIHKGEHRGVHVLVFRGIEVAAADCTIVTGDARRVVEPGAFELLVGRSSRERDLLRAAFTVAD